MDFFNEIMKFGDIFESQETIDELKDISDEIKKYDVYDVLARISGLNLMPHNQNKSVLLDSLIAGIICEEENTYNSTYKMSAGKFKKLIGKINETNLALSIDPNENAFYQNVMLMDNYTVFNGIDNTPAYNLQMLIDAKTRFAYFNGIRMTLTATEPIFIDSDNIVDGYYCLWTYEGNEYESGTFTANSTSANSPWNTMSLRFNVY
ncbi:MAG: hypothetical protein J6B69_10550 [Lachnospiraceae bacterium]|nr:hypothetical protein [Lachnospiraceae bacterium]